MQPPDSEHIINSFAAVTLVSAASIGANFVEVRKGTISPALAVGNGVAKGVVAQTLLAKPPSSASQAFLAAGCLALSSYVIDSVMKSPAMKRKKSGSEQKSEVAS